MTAIGASLSTTLPDTTDVTKYIREQGARKGEFTVKGTEQERLNQPRKAPIDLQEEVRRRAYQIYEERGMLNGFELEDWLEAEAEVLDRQRMQKAA
jgi:hypothetical protein